MNENHDAFDEYVLKFDMNERMIAYKYNHSYRVVHQAEEICRSLELDTYERDIASLIALLHDIARFRQWKDFKTFNDSESFDHGDEGVKILFDEGEINNYQVDKKEYDVVKKAIKNHNKFKLDTKNNIWLRNLRLDSNLLTSLDVSCNLCLEELYCMYNPNLTEVWLKEGQYIQNFNYNADITTIKYK